MTQPSRKHNLNFLSVARLFAYAINWYLSNVCIAIWKCDWTESDYICSGPIFDRINEKINLTEQFWLFNRRLNLCYVDISFQTYVHTKEMEWIGDSCNWVLGSRLDVVSPRDESLLSCFFILYPSYLA